jgi:hypothetical protein
MWVCSVLPCAALARHFTVQSGLCCPCAYVPFLLPVALVAVVASAFTCWNAVRQPWLVLLGLPAVTGFGSRGHMEAGRGVLPVVFCVCVVACTLHQVPMIPSIDLALTSARKSRCKPPSVTSSLAGLCQAPSSFLLLLCARAARGAGPSPCSSRTLVLTPRTPSVGTECALRGHRLHLTHRTTSAFEASERKVS